MKLIVSYDFRSGEFENNGYSILNIRKGEKPEEVIENYYSDFWGEEQTQHEGNGIYSGWGYSVCIKIKGWKLCNDKDFKVISKYF